MRIILCIFYIAFIFHMTLCNRSLTAEYIFYGPFWEIREHMWGDIIKNIVLFIPLGAIIGGRKCVIIGFLLSCGIEITQYFLRLGYCEIDDVLNNTIGTIIGALINLLIVYRYSKLLK